MIDTVLKEIWQCSDKFFIKKQGTSVSCKLYLIRSSFNWHCNEIIPKLDVIVITNFLNTVHVVSKWPFSINRTCRKRNSVKVRPLSFMRSGIFSWTTLLTPEISVGYRGALRSTKTSDLQSNKNKNLSIARNMLDRKHGSLHEHKPRIHWAPRHSEPHTSRLQRL